MVRREEVGKYSPDEWREASGEQEREYFLQRNRFCGFCGAPTERFQRIGVRCKGCGKEIFPGLSPAIVVLVTRGSGSDEEALLVHAANFKRPMYALVAGFVEPGETLEQCVEREVKEETTLEIRDVRYIGSQSWPFPSQLMTGFRARYARGEISFADGELTSGGWYRRDSLPELPLPGSLSRAIIDAWVEEGTGLAEDSVNNI